MVAMFAVYVLVMLCASVSCKSHVHVCGRANHNGSNGELLPHNGILPAGHDCSWHIYPENFNIPEVYMVIEDFELDPGDRFTVSKHDSDRLFGPFNGTKDTFTILTGNLMLDVDLKTASSPTKDRHFKAFFTTNDCYYLIEDESGTMASPLYNSVAHRKSIKCEWRFRKFKQVTLPRTVAFSTFHLTNSTLMIKGSKAGDGIYTGTKLPKDIIAYGETQFILNLNTSVPGETFSFKYGMNLNTLNVPSSENKLVGLNDDDSTQLSVSAPLLTVTNGVCGHTNLRSLNGWFAPKNKTMTAQHTCIWSIQPGPLQESSGIYIAIEESRLVSDDIFILRRWQSSSEVLLGPYFGNIGLFSLFTDESKADAVLQTSNSKQFLKRSFNAYYSTAGCNYEITNLFGVIHSPFYKANNQKKLACTWKFGQDDTSSIVSLSFDKYNIKTSQLQVTGSVNQDQMYKASDGPFDVLMKVNGQLTLEIDRTTENETLSFSYNTVTPECSNYTKIIGTDSVPLEFPPAGSNNIDSFNCQWIIESKKGVLAVYFEDIQLADAEDMLVIKDGKTRASPKLIQVTESSQDNLKGSYLVSTTNVIWLSFSTHYPFKGSHFKLSVNISEQGGHLHGGQDFTIVPPESGVDVIFYLEVEKDEQVLLNLLPDQKLPSSGIISVYNGFTVNSPLLTEIKHNKEFYPVASTGSKIMLIAKGFAKNASVKLSFKGVTKGCHHVTLDQHGTYSLAGNCNNTCSWAILPSSSNKEEMLSLHLSSVALRPGDVIQVKQLDDALSLLDTITLNENHMPNVYIPASSGAYINITRGVCLTTEAESTAFSASAELLKGCSVNIEIDSGEKVSLRSPNYPDSYPFNSHCYWNVSTKAKNLYLSFENFQLASGHCLKIHEIDDGRVLDSFTYGISNVPSDKMLKNNIAIELIASPCVQSNTTSPSSRGNGFLLELFALDCGGALGKELRGTFNTPDFPNQVTKSLLCIWNVEVPHHNSDNSVNVISFDIQWSSPSTDEETGLTIYDGQSLSSGIFINETTNIDLLSRTNILIFVYEQKDTSKSHAALKVDFELRAGNTLCDNGLYMHPDWVCNGIDECGDYSDEKNCKGRSPLPPPVSPVPPNINVTKSGVSRTVFWSVVPTAFVIGIIATLGTAFILTEVKKRRQDNYDTLPILPP